MRRLNKAQSTAEYAIVIGLVIAAAVAMQIYVKRNLQARIQSAVDHPPDAAIFTTKQFEPDYLETANLGMHATSESQEKITSSTGGGVTRNIIGASTTTKTGIQVLKNATE